MASNPRKAFVAHRHFCPDAQGRWRFRDCLDVCLAGSHWIDTCGKSLDFVRDWKSDCWIWERKSYCWKKGLQGLRALFITDFADVKMSSCAFPFHEKKDCRIDRAELNLCSLVSVGWLSHKRENFLMFIIANYWIVLFSKLMYSRPSIHQKLGIDASSSSSSPLIVSINTTLSSSRLVISIDKICQMDVVL